MEDKDTYTKDEVIKMMKVLYEVDEARVQHAIQSIPEKRAEIGSKFVYELIPMFLKTVPDSITGEVLDMKCLENSLELA